MKRLDLIDMKTENVTFTPLSATNRQVLNCVREHRRFVVEQYVEMKTTLLINYLRSAGLTGCVVAVSGGIDSAVVLGLLTEAQKRYDMTVFPVTLPACSSKGVTHQDETVNKANLLIKHFQKQNHTNRHNFWAFPNYCYKINIDDEVSDIASNVFKAIGNFYGSNLPKDYWAIGQLVPYTRTPYLYFIATMMKEKGIPSVIVGTTNRDEGAYLGYVGKASDGMVDIQLISDLHKSEVYQLAKYLNIPQEIIDAVPTGDMYNGKSDVEMFGASYDSVELYITNPYHDQDASNIEAMHQFNAHKYFAGSPAVHLDIFESGVKGGWPIQFETKYWTELKKRGDFIAPNFVAPLPFTKFQFDDIYARHIKTMDYTEQLTNVLSANEIDQLKAYYASGQKKDANAFGYTGTDGKKASSRASFYSVEFAEVLWNRIRSHIDLLFHATVPVTDWKEGEIYRAIGINPLFRFIGYSDQGTLVPHYDYAYDDGENKTLFTLILYLTNNKTGGTRFIPDYQEDSWEKNLDDWTIEQAKVVKSSDCFVVKPTAGNALIFPHHLLHDAEMVYDEEKLIIRTDIVCQKIKHS